MDDFERRRELRRQKREEMRQETERMTYQRNDDDDEEAARERRRRSRLERQRLQKEEDGSADVNSQNSLTGEETKSTSITNTEITEDDEAALLDRLAKREERRQKRMKEAMERQKELDPTITDESLSFIKSNRNGQNEVEENDTSRKEVSVTHRHQYEVEETETMIISHEKNDQKEEPDVEDKVEEEKTQEKEDLPEETTEEIHLEENQVEVAFNIKNVTKVSRLSEVGLDGEERDLVIKVQLERNENDDDENETERQEAEESRAADERERVESERRAAEERERMEEEAKREAAERERVEAERKAAEERERLEEEARREAEQRERKRQQEQERKAAEERAEAERKAEERRKAEEKKAQEEREKLEAEQRRAAEEKRKAEEKRATEERDRKKAEKKAAEDKKAAEEKARLEAKKEEKVKAEDKKDKIADDKQVKEKRAAEEKIQPAFLRKQGEEKDSKAEAKKDKDVHFRTGFRKEEVKDEKKGFKEEAKANWERKKTFPETKVQNGEGLHEGTPSKLKQLEKFGGAKSAVSTDEADTVSKVEAGKKLDDLRRRRGETESGELDKMKQKQQEAADEQEERKKRREERKKLMEEEEQKKKEEEAQRKSREDEEKKRMKEEIEKRRAEAAAKRQNLPEDGVPDDKKAFKSFTPKASSLKIEERAEFLNRSTQKSVKSNQPSAVSKIDSRLEQYTSAIGNNKNAKSSKAAPSDIPLPSDGVRNIKSKWETGNVFSSPGNVVSPNKETAGLKVGVSSRINEWLTKTPETNKSPATKPSDLRPVDISGKRNLWEKQQVEKSGSPSKVATGGKKSDANGLRFEKEP